MEDRERPGRPASATAEKTAEIADMLAKMPMNSVHLISKEVDMSKSVVHRIMRHILGYKLYKMRLTQQDH